MASHYEVLERMAFWRGDEAFHRLRRGCQTDAPFCTDSPSGGTWHDQTADWEARRRGETVRYYDFRSEQTVVLEPITCWQHLPQAEIQERIRHMVREIEQETAERHRRNGTRVLGRKAVQRVHPHDSPENPKRDLRPPFHAATLEVREAMKQAYREFLEFFRAAAQDLRAGLKGVRFPPGSFPPGLPYVPPEAAPA